MEFVGLAPDVIVTGTTPAAIVLQRETRSIPVVFVNLADPVGTGLVRSLANPDGNMTGFTAFEFSITGKWLELLKEIAPRVTRVALIFGALEVATVGELFYRTFEAAARAASVEPIAIRIRTAADIDPAIDAFAAQPNVGLVAAAEVAAVTHRVPIINAVARHRLPAVYPFRYFATDGGLAAYDISNNLITGAAFLGTVGMDWQVTGFGSFSGVDPSDMILRNVNSGGVEVYISNNQITGAAFMGTVGLNWQFSGIGNFSGLGESDMLLRNANTGGLEVYDIANNQNHQRRLHRRHRAELEVLRRREFQRRRRRNRSLVAQRPYRRARSLQHRQQPAHQCGSSARLVWIGSSQALLRSTLPARPISCCATSILANSRSMILRATLLSEPPAWARSAWIGSSAVSRPIRRAAPWAARMAQPLRSCRRWLVLMAAAAQARL
jgi:ABC transporter substrate binding protein